MNRKLKYYKSVYRRFGYRAIWFLISSKFAKNKLSDLKYKYLIAPISKRKNKLKEKLIKVIYFKSLLPFSFTYELWNKFHTPTLESQNFEIPELNIKGDLREACELLVQITWQYNNKVK